MIEPSQTNMTISKIEFDQPTATIQAIERAASDLTSNKQSTYLA